MSNPPAYRTGDPRIVVAVIDGPVDLGHPCFHGARIDTPWGMPEIDQASPAARHGTHVTSIILGQPGSPVTGIAPGCRGLAFPVFCDRPQSGPRCSQRDLARALLTALDHGAHIISISGGEPCNPGAADAFLVDALHRCAVADVLVLAAAGNDGTATPHVPAALPGVMAIGAADRHGLPLISSNFASSYRRNGLLVLGESITGAVPGGGVTTGQGTSFAVAVASGVAARLLATDLQNGGRTSPAEIGKVMLGNAVSCADREMDGGRCLTGRLDPACIFPAAVGGRDLLKEKNGRGEVTMSETIPNDGPVEPGMGLSALANEAATEPMQPAELPRIPRTGLKLSGCGCGCEESENSTCNCGGKKAPAPQAVYALGQIGYDFGSEARRDSIRQFMRPSDPFAGEEELLIEHLRNPENIEDVERVIWTLTLDGSPIYALLPCGAFAAEAYARIFTSFSEQVIGRPVEKEGKKTKDHRKVILHAVPGRVSGSVRLMSGEVVPVLLPVTRAIAGWDVESAVETFLVEYENTLNGTKDEKQLREQIEKMAVDLPPFLNDYRNLMTRKYRNLGIAGRDRALNFAATSSFRVFQVLSDIAGLNLILDDIEVTRSPACRAGSECYDVGIRFFREADATAALHTFQFTVDVSDVVPVSIGPVSKWRERPNT